MTQAEMQKTMETVFRECRELRNAGQKEYAHEESNAFANFERAAQEVDSTREKTLWTFAMKHKDGIASWIKGHRSQREDVRGRINDLIVYLCLLRGMVDESEAKHEETIRRADATYQQSQRAGPTYSAVHDGLQDVWSDFSKPL